jgi:hypothetical protein
MNIITLLAFAEDLSNETMSTVDNAEVVAVTIAPSIRFTTVGIYEKKQETKIDVNGATYENFFEPVASIAAAPG